MATLSEVQIPKTPTGGGAPIPIPPSGSGSSSSGKGGGSGSVPISPKPSLKLLMKLLADCNVHIHTINAELAKCGVVTTKGTPVPVKSAPPLPVPSSQTTVPLTKAPIKNGCSAQAIARYKALLGTLEKTKARLQAEIDKLQGKGKHGSITSGSSADGTDRSHQDRATFNEAIHSDDGTTDGGSTAMDWFKQATTFIDTTGKAIKNIKGGDDTQTDTGSGTGSGKKPTPSTGMSPMTVAIIAVAVIGAGIGVYYMVKKK